MGICPNSQNDMCNLYTRDESKMSTCFIAWSSFSTRDLNPQTPTSRKNSEIFSFFRFMNFPHMPTAIVKWYQSHPHFRVYQPSPQGPDGHSPILLEFSYVFTANHDPPRPWRFQNRWSILSIPCCRPDHHAIPRETLQQPEGKPRPNPTGGNLQMSGPVTWRALES